MVKIRLTRMGAKKRPFYRLVVADSRSPRDGRFIEALGYYDPLTNPATVVVDEEKVRSWIARGARPSDSAREVLQQQGILPRGPMVEYPAKPAPEAAAASAAAETPAAEAPETAGTAAEAEPEAVTAEAEA